MVFLKHRLVRLFILIALVSWAFHTSIAAIEKQPAGNPPQNTPVVQSAARQTEGSFSGTSVLGVSTTPGITVSPQTLPLVTIIQGTTAYSVFTITNTGGADLVYSLVNVAGGTTNSTASLQSVAKPFTPPRSPFATNLSTESIPGEMIVKFKKGITSSRRAELQKTANMQVIRYYKIIDSYLVKVNTGNTVTSSIQTLSQYSSEVEYAEPNAIRKLCTTPNDPYFNYQWALKNTGQFGGTTGADIDATDAWNYGTGSPNIVVGLLDTGVDYTHPDLIDNVYHNPNEIANNGVDDDGNGYIDDTIGWNFVSNTNDPMDDNGHGSHCMGIMAAEGNNGVGVVGVNWHVKVLPIKIFDANGNTTEDAILQGIQYAVTMGVNLTSNSWGGDTEFWYSEYAVISAANAANQMFIAAAGNESNNTDVIPNYPSGYALPNVISVAATDYNDQLATFSNYGPQSVHLAAPGLQIYSTVSGGGYDYKSGTSMATPYVAGAVALLLSRNPNLKVSEIRQLLFNSVDTVAGLSGKCLTGGRLNLRRLLQMGVNTWLDENPHFGTISAGSFSVITVIYNSGSLTTGDTTGYINIYNNSSTSPVLITVPLRVTGRVPAPNFSATPLQAYTPATVSFTDSSLYNPQSWKWSFGDGGTDTTQNPIHVYTNTGTFSVTLIASNSYGAGTIVESNYVQVNAYPVITFSPSSIMVTMAPVTTAFSIVTVQNTGGATASNLNWNFYSSRDSSLVTNFKSSDQSGGPVYSWIDITSTGTLIPGASADDSNIGPLPISFPFSFYGSVFTTFRVCSNGYLSFSDMNSIYNNYSLPNAEAPANLVAPFWRDLDLTYFGSVYYQNFADKLVVSFINAPLYDSDASNETTAMTFQVILNQDGTIVYQYKQFIGDSTNCTVGVQDGTKTIGLTVSYDAPFLHENMAVKIYIPGLTWVSNVPATGITGGNQLSLSTVIFNSKNLVVGTVANGNLIITSNDTARGIAYIPIQVTISTTQAPIPATGSLNVSNLIAMPSYGGIKLYWQNPTRNDYSGTLINYRTDRYPLNPSDGTIIYWYNGIQSNFAGTNGQKYYFGIFCHDTAMNFSSGAFIAGIPNSYSNVRNFSMYVPWLGAAGFNWVNPTETGQHDSEILIRRRDRLPVDPADGYDPTSGLWFQYWYNTQSYGEMGLTVGSTYYYGIYGVDTMENFSGGLAGAFIPGYSGLGNVSTVQFIPGYGTIQASWINPSGANYVSTLMVKKSGSYPSNPTDGNIAYWSNGQSFLDSGLIIGNKYYYGLFTQDTAGKFSPGIFGGEYAGNYANVKNITATPGNGFITLGWQNPNRTDYLKTVIIRRTDRMALNATDGTQVYWNNGTTFSDTSVTNGQVYYYSFFAHDAYYNPSEGIGISAKPSASATESPVMMTAAASLESSPLLAQQENSNIGWNDNLGDFSQPNRIYFWGTDGSSEQADNMLVLQGDNTKLTLKNSLIGKPVKVTVTYTADKSVTITPVLLVNNEDQTIAAVVTPYQSQTVTQDGKQITTAEIQGYGDDVQLQFVIQNPNKTVIKINSIQLILVSSLKVAHTNSLQYANLM